MTSIEKTRVSKITELHLEIGGMLKMTLDKAIEIGDLLQQQKAQTKHGEWIPWMQEHLPFSERLARDYMRFYEHREELKTASLAVLTEARRYLTPPPEEKEEKLEVDMETMSRIIDALMPVFLEGRKLEKPQIPDNWDYDESVKEAKGHFSKMAAMLNLNLTYPGDTP